MAEQVLFDSREETEERVGEVEEAESALEAAGAVTVRRDLPSWVWLIGQEVLGGQRTARRMAEVAINIKSERCCS